VTKVFYVLFFLINGQWEPASNYEGYAVKEAGQTYEAHEIDKKMAICELGQELLKETNKNIQKDPEGANMPGVPVKIHGVSAACFKVELPQ